MIYIYDGGSLSVTEEEEKKKDFYSSSIRLGYEDNEDRDNDKDWNNYTDRDNDE